MRPLSTVGKESRAQRRQHILQAYRKSGLPQRQFAARAGIGYSTLTFWLRQSRPQDKPQRLHKPALVAVPNLFPGHSPHPGFRLQLPGGVIVEFAPGFRAEELAAVLRALRSL
jgi:lambda repressor-like predicted transcriptional regulator